MKRLRLSITALTLVLGWGLAGAALAQDAKGKAMDQQFVAKAARDGMAEVRLGRMAMDQAADLDVKQFGQRMVTDHTQANQELTTIAKNKNIPVPAELDKEQQSMAESLAKVTGANFDREYVRHMVQDHEKAVELFSRQAQEGTDAELKAFAKKTLPTLQEHLSLARTLAKQHEVSQAR